MHNENLTELINQAHLIGEVKATYSTNVKPEDRIHINSCEIAVKVLRDIFPADKIELQEMFVVLLLNRANRAIGWSIISTGGMNSCLVDPKILFQLALVAGASGIMVAHNHPSGETNPSQQDRVLTKRLAEGAKLLEITFLDHIIVTATDRYYSFAEMGEL